MRPSTPVFAERRIRAILRGQRLTLMPTLPLAVLAVLATLAIAAPVVTSLSPVRADLAHSLMPPASIEGGSAGHLLGTDPFGLDVLSRLVDGARISLSGALLSISGAATAGTVVGVVAGYLGGWLDSFLMRLVDML